jgi:hypothetical protein
LKDEPCIGIYPRSTELSLLYVPVSRLLNCFEMPIFSGVCYYLVRLPLRLKGHCSGTKGLRNFLGSFEPRLVGGNDCFPQLRFS